VYDERATQPPREVFAERGGRVIVGTFARRLFRDGATRTHIREGAMEKVKLSLEELAVESFSVEIEKARGTVNANEFKPTARTFECPCIEHTAPAECG
jgi:hypothetical protein